MNKIVMYSPTDAQIDIQERQVVLLFPNQSTVHFSLDIPDLRCAGHSPTYTYRAWMWCMYVNALHAAQIQLEDGHNHKLFRKIWRKIISSGGG
jgi:hypothetical protein